MALSAEAKKKQAAYAREYRARNREHHLATRREYYAQNKDKVKEWKEAYWERKVEDTAEFLQ